jgi:hypothetical protein
LTAASDPLQQRIFDAIVEAARSGVEAARTGAD